MRDMLGLFWDAVSFNQPLDQWTPASVETMYGMFHGASSFNQDLCDWGSKLDSTKIVNLPWFSGTQCPSQDEPNLGLTPPGPFCYECTTVPPPTTPTNPKLPSEPINALTFDCASGDGGVGLALQGEGATPTDEPVAIQYPQWMPSETGPSCFLRLTSDVMDSVKKAVSAFVPFQFADNNPNLAFSTTFGYRIYRESPGILGDGFAFVLHQDPRGTSALGGFGGGLGVHAWSGRVAIYPSLAIEFDTCTNTSGLLVRRTAAFWHPHCLIHCFFPFFS